MKGGEILVGYNVIVKLTPKCNMRCEYCNVEKNSGADFPYEEIDKLIDWLNTACLNKVCSVLWHGGEPLVLGYDYFVKIFASQSRYPGRFKNTLSTNGLLLTDKMIDLLAENSVTIKTSLDSIDVKHDKQRDYSCDKVIASLNRLKERDYKDVYVRTTISKVNQSLLPDMYDFMRENYSDFTWEFSPIVPAGLNKEAAKALLPDAEVFCESALQIFRHWFEQNPLEIPLFTEIIKCTLKFNIPLEITRPRLNVGHDGMIYSCPLLIGNQDYKLGRYNENTALEAFRETDCVWKRISKPECFECRYNRFCRFSSCAYLAVSLEGIDGIVDFYCKLWTSIYAEICATVSLELYTENP